MSYGDQQTVSTGGSGSGLPHKKPGAQAAVLALHPPVSAGAMHTRTDDAADGRKDDVSLAASSATAASRMRGGSGGSTGSVLGLASLQQLQRTDSLIAARDAMAAGRAAAGTRPQHGPKKQQQQQKQKPDELDADAKRQSEGRPRRLKQRIRSASTPVTTTTGPSSSFVSTAAANAADRPSWPSPMLLADPLVPIDEGGAVPYTTLPRQAFTSTPSASASAAAANAVHKPSESSQTLVADPLVPVNEGGAMPYTTLSRQAFTSKPTLQMDLDEKRRADVLRASAIAMAKGMFEQQQRVVEQAKRAAEGAQSRQVVAATRQADRAEQDQGLSSVSASSQKQPDLHEAAYRLAQERLARLQDEHVRARERGQDPYLDHGHTARSALGDEHDDGLGSTLHRQASVVLGRLVRHRSASDGAVAEEKQHRGRRLLQYDHLNQSQQQQRQSLTTEEDQKRAAERTVLLQTAARNVRRQLEGMDEEIALKTAARVSHGHHLHLHLPSRSSLSNTSRGAVVAGLSPKVRGEWQARASAAALARSEERRGVKRTTARRAMTAPDAEKNASERADEKLAAEAAKSTTMATDDINRDSRQQQQQGQHLVDIGAGRFMGRHEVEAIAARRVRPVLDDITRRAEEERERQRVAREEKERRRLEAEAKMEKEREEKRIKGEFIS